MPADDSRPSFALRSAGRLALALGLAVVGGFFVYGSLFQSPEPAADKPIPSPSPIPPSFSTESAADLPPAVAPAESVPAPPAAVPSPGQTLVAPRQRPTREETIKLMEEPRLRESTTRYLARNYAPLFAQLNLSPKAEDLLLQLLVDSTLVVDVEEIFDYDHLIAELLTPEQVQQLKTYQGEMAFTNLARNAADDAGLGELPPESPQQQALVALVKQTFREDMRFWRDSHQQAQSGRLTVAALDAIAAEARQRFATRLQSTGATFSPDQLEQLRAWYEQTTLKYRLSSIPYYVPVTQN